MLEDYLNQKAILKNRIGINAYNEPVFETKEINCRIINKFKQLVGNKSESSNKGEIVVSSGVVECLDLIEVGDLVDDREVISSSPMVGLDEIVGYRGFLR